MGMRSHTHSLPKLSPVEYAKLMAEAEAIREQQRVFEMKVARFYGVQRVADIPPARTPEE
jgi:hypothetical protein